MTEETAILADARGWREHAEQAIRERDEARRMARHCFNVLRACGLEMGPREEREAPDWLTAAPVAAITGEEGPPAGLFGISGYAQEAER